jgi:hypothetical protein
VVQSAVDPGGGGASEVAFGTSKPVEGAKQETTPDLLYWGCQYHHLQQHKHKQQHKWLQHQHQHQHQLHSKQQHKQHHN